MRKSIMLFLFCTIVLIYILPLQTQAAETVSVTIQCKPDVANGADAISFFYSLNCHDTANQNMTIYSDTNSAATFSFKKNSSVQIVIKVIGNGTPKTYEEDIYINNTNLNFGNGLTGTMISPNHLKITGIITGDTSITIYAVPNALKDVFDYEETVTENEDSNVIEEESRQVSPGSRYDGLKRIINLVPAEDKTDVWEKVKAKLYILTDLINLITNAFVAFGILTGLLVLILQFVKIQAMPSHPMQRHRSMVEFVSSIVCIALLGSIKLLTVLILSIAAS